MLVNDPIADMLTRIRNALVAKHDSILVPASNEKKAVAKILLDEGFIKSVDLVEDGVQGALYGDWHQLWVQIFTTLVSIVFSAVVTYVLYKAVDKLIGIRVDKRVEEEGLDIYEHGETAYN